MPGTQVNPRSGPKYIKVDPGHPRGPSLPKIAKRSVTKPFSACRPPQDRRWCQSDGQGAKPHQHEPVCKAPDQPRNRRFWAASRPNLAPASVLDSPAPVIRRSSGVVSPGRKVPMAKCSIDHRLATTAEKAKHVPHWGQMPHVGNSKFTILSCWL